MPKHWGEFWEDAFIYLILIYWATVVFALFFGYRHFKAGNKVQGGLLLAFGALNVLLQLGSRLDQLK